MSKRSKEIADAKEWFASYFHTFEDRLNGYRNIPFHEIRKTAIDRFSEIGFPGRKDEDWKYTRVTPILKYKFRLADGDGAVSEARVRPFMFKGLEKRVVVFINGRFSPRLSTFPFAAEQVYVNDLKTALKEKGELLQKYLAKYADFQKNPFTALNTAYALDGACIYLPDNTVVEEPIHLLYLVDPGDDPVFTNPRNLVIVGKNSRLRLIESYHTLNEGIYFNNGVTEVVLEEDAHVEHVKVQDESKQAFHIATVQVEQTARSVYSMVNIDLGGALVRNNINIVLDAEYCEAHLYGFYMGSGKQHIDNHTFIDHARANCESNETYRGILSGKATGVFNGKVYVRPDAQKTNAYQSNKALLLSDDATVNSKPELEIYADDVKCSHGATVGQLDEEALFYLRSRGIPEDKALSMLQHAFAIDIFENITIETVREQLENTLLERFEMI